MITNRLVSDEYIIKYIFCVSLTKRKRR